MEEAGGRHRPERLVSHLIQDSTLAITYLRLLLWQLHIVKNPEHDSEQVLPPVLFKGVAIALHDLEHDCESPGENEARRGRGHGEGEERS